MIIKCLKIVMVLCVGLCAANLDAAEGSSKVLSENGLAFKKDVKVEFGEGHGETRDEAIREALKDVLQKVVGVYVDSEFRMNNDEIIKDQIITHSNGFIEKYDVIEEGDSDDGRGKVVTIRARVKMREFMNQMKRITPSQTIAMDGNLLASDMQGQLNAEALIRKEFESFDYASLVNVNLVKDIRPEIRSSTKDDVTIRYVYTIRYSNKRYFKEFLPRFTKLLNQIAIGKPETKTYKSEVAKVNFHPTGFTQFQPFRNRYSYHKEVWEERSVEGFCFDMRRNYPNEWQSDDPFERKTIAIIQKISGGVLQVKEWTLSEHLAKVFQQEKQNAKHRVENMNCVLTAFDENKETLAFDVTPMPGTIAPLMPKVDFLPLVNNSEDFVMDWDEKIVGYIDLTMNKSDVGKIKSIELKLEPRNQRR